MKAIGAALIAAGILYVVDLEYNDGRYASIVKSAIVAVIRGR